MLDVDKIREDFPILLQEINGKKLVYLDNAATSQLPLSVLTEIKHHYLTDNANIHRGVHTLSEKSTQKYEDARKKVADFIGATSEEVIFTSGTTAAINLVAMSLGGCGLAGNAEPFLQEGDEIIISQYEHHANFLPWQELSHSLNLELKIVPCPQGEFDFPAYKSMLNEKTKLVCISHMTNVSGSVFPILEIAQAAHKTGALVLIDGAQGIAHGGIDLSVIPCDFYCFSGHKMLAPTGIGILFARKSVQRHLAPVFFGGGIVDRVDRKTTSYLDPPLLLEAGTPNYTGAIALARAIEYIENLGVSNIYEREKALTGYCLERVSSLPKCKLIGHPRNRMCIISFYIPGIHPFDLSGVLNHCGVAVRSGSHCAQPVFWDYDTDTCTRISLSFYNTVEEIDQCMEAIELAQKLLG